MLGSLQVKVRQILLLFLFAIRGETFLPLVHASKVFSESSVKGDDDTSRGVSIKKLIREAKERRKLPPLKTNYDLDGNDRGDIKVLKDFYKNGGMKNDESTKTSSSNKNDELDVIIVGAGWAGLSAAMTLEAKGITNYKILEARDYVGGRSYTVKETFDGEDVPIDMGSMWLHGGVENPLYEVIETVGGIPLFESLFDQILYKENNGGPLPDRQALDYYYRLFENGFIEYQAARQESTKKDQPLQVSADKYINTLSVNLEKQAAKKFMTEFIELEYSGRMDEMSLWWWDMDNYFSFVDLFLPGGYSSLVEAYAAPVMDKIEMETKVTHIGYKTNNVKVAYIKNGSKSRLTTKKVIVTVPLGVLKANSIKFWPKLPNRARKCIKKIGMGRQNKIFMFWNPSDVFWPRGVELLTDLVDRDTNFQFLNPSAYNDNKPMLFAIYSGNNIENLEDQETFEKQVTTLAMTSLRSMYGNSIKDPEKVVVTKWNKDQYSMGAYSFNKVFMGRNCRKQLAKPIKKKRLYIAGEATSFHYFATTHGAHFEGTNTALKVVQALKNDINE